MNSHYILGITGESQAASFLENKGYTILHRNWRSGHKELDIVATIDNTLIIVEVKTRSTTNFGNPEEAVNISKIRKIVSATDAYIRFFSIDIPVRFDIITIINKNGVVHLEHIIEAFFPPISK
ncbi:MAG TPA: YraN family protein [Bacteroidaceae bacterium]|nr:YraN family protein [Bacteroidaceae bacterium]